MTRLRSNTRPVPIDMEALEAFWLHELLPTLRMRLARLPPGAMGKRGGVAMGHIRILGADQKTNIRVLVQFEAIPYGDARPEGGGNWNDETGRSVITLYLNGSLSAAVYLLNDELWARMSEGLYSTLTHEITHAADGVVPHRQASYRFTDKETGESKIDRDRYFNEPLEVRAVMRQVVDIAKRAASDPRIREICVEDKDEKPNDVLLHYALMQGPYRSYRKHMSAKNQALILRAVADAFTREGLWFPR